MSQVLDDSLLDDPVRLANVGRLIRIASAGVSSTRHMSSPS